MNDSACIRGIRVYVILNFQTMYLEQNLLSSHHKHAEAFCFTFLFAEAWQNICITYNTYGSGLMFIFF